MDSKLQPGNGQRWVKLNGLEPHIGLCVGGGLSYRQTQVTADADALALHHTKVVVTGGEARAEDDGSREAALGTVEILELSFAEETVVVLKAVDQVPKAPGVRIAY